MRHERLEIDEGTAAACCVGTDRWRVKRQKGSHKILEREGWPDYVFAFHDSVEIGAKMAARIGKKTGLKPEDI